MSILLRTDFFSVSVYDQNKFISVLLKYCQNSKSRLQTLDSLWVSQTICRGGPKSHTIKKTSMVARLVQLIVFIVVASLLDQTEALISLFNDCYGPNMVVTVFHPSTRDLFISRNTACRNHNLHWHTGCTDCGVQIHCTSRWIRGQHCLGGQLTCAIARLSRVVEKSQAPDWHDWISHKRKGRHHEHLVSTLRWPLCYLQWIHRSMKRTILLENVYQNSK